MGARFFFVSSVLNQMSMPIARVRRAATMMPQAWSFRYVRLRWRKKAGRLRRKVTNIMMELIIEAVESLVEVEQARPEWAVAYR